MSKNKAKDVEAKEPGSVAGLGSVEALSVSAPPGVGETTSTMEGPALAVGMKKLPNDRGYLAYVVTVQEGKVTQTRAIYEDVDQPAIPSKDGAWNLVRRKAVELFMLEGAEAQETDEDEDGEG